VYIGEHLQWSIEAIAAYKITGRPSKQTNGWINGKIFGISCIELEPHHPPNNPADFSIHEPRAIKFKIILISQPQLQ